MASLKLEGIHKRYGELTVVKDVNLDIENGDFVVLVGPSGCGKSTTLRMIAGLEEISAGKLYIGDRVVNELSPRDRDVAMVFQSYALYPHMTVADNISFGLKLRKMEKTEIERRVNEAAQILEIKELLERKPKALSGGQRQRVAMGRAIVRKPEVFLFDEPLSNLDAKLRVQMRAEIAKLYQRLGVTTVYVTHDQVEAMTLAKHIVVMNKGVVQQVGAPLELYRAPVNTFVATFIGSPAMNLFPVTLVDQGGPRLVGQDLDLPVPERLRPALGSQKSLTLGIRPEHLHAAQPTDVVTTKARVDVVEPLGFEVHILGELGGQPITAKLDPDVRVKAGDTIPLGIDLEHIHLFDRETTMSLVGKAPG
jgi:multiple sugar transport system ATP-binding protein